MALPSREIGMLFWFASCTDLASNIMKLRRENSVALFADGRLFLEWNGSSRGREHPTFEGLRDLTSQRCTSN